MSTYSPEAAALVIEGLVTNGLLDRRQVQDMAMKAEAFLETFRSLYRTSHKGTKAAHCTMAVQPTGATPHQMGAGKTATPKSVFSKTDIRNPVYRTSTPINPKKLDEDPSLKEASAIIASCLTSEGLLKYHELRKLGGNVVQMGKQVRRMMFEKRLKAREDFLRAMTPQRLNHAVGACLRFCSEKFKMMEDQNLQGVELLMAMAREEGIGL